MDNLDIKNVLVKNLDIRIIDKIKQETMKPLIYQKIIYQMDLS